MKRRDLREIYRDDPIALLRITELREIGEWGAIVRFVKNSEGELSDKQIEEFLDIKPQTVLNIRSVINEHPDWDEYKVAEEVLYLEDE